MGRRKCIFCRPDYTEFQLHQLHYTNVDLLHKFINERGMIFSRTVTHTCTKHQNRLEKEIKRARILGLLSPLSNWRVPSHFLVSKMTKRPAGVIPPKHPLAYGLEDETSVPDPRFMPRDDIILRTTPLE